MMRFFINANGLVYKADEPKYPDDMERMNASPEQIDALPDDGSAITVIEYGERVNLFRQGFSFNKQNKLVYLGVSK